MGGGADNIFFFVRHQRTLQEAMQTSIQKQLGHMDKFASSRVWGGGSVPDGSDLKLIYWRDSRGLMLWLFVGPTGVYLLDFFCSGIQFYLLLRPYLCFISFLYLDLYVLGEDALIS